ncbi:putative C-type lectin domain family 20 member A [Danio rerio]|uniref:C-type lectin domain family 20 member A n=1 Tax=Danio rerio TaxID=7955 RepID=A0AB32TWA9_DANRE
MKTTLAVLLLTELYTLSSALSKQHFFVDDEKSWSDAKQHCQTNYNDLSTFINDSEKQQFLDDAVNQTSDAWVGLYNEYGVWKWSRDEIATQIDWDSEQPDGQHEDCAFLHKDHKKMHDEKCNKKQRFFCMTKSVLMPETKTWEGALEHCRQHYNDLASLSSQLRVNSALQGISQAQTEYVWTGLRFLAGDWRWISGDDLDHTVWPVTGQPSCPAVNLRCGAVHRQTRVWMARDCEESLNFLCQ